MKNFLKQVIATMFAIVLLAVMVMLAFAILEVRDRPKAAGILTIDLSRPLVDRGGSPSLASRLQGASQSELPLHRALTLIRGAAGDDAIDGILLHGGVTGGTASLSEVRDALADFKKSGKRVFAWFLGYDDKSYYLASIADRVLVSPLSDVMLDGLEAEVLYYKDALTKFGLEMQVTRAGKYKSAVEPYLADHMSDENREQLRTMLDDISGSMLAEIAVARGIPVETLSRCVTDTPVLSGKDAVGAKLVDAIAAFQDVATELTAIAGTDEANGSFVQIGLEDYAKQHEDADTTGDRQIGVVFAEGLIHDGESEEFVAGDTVARKLRELRRDDDVKAVVLRIDSPGGSASASEVILDEVRRLRAAGKPVVASMGDVAASGGYWIASLADAIVAHPTTITGSIGVFGMFPNAEQTLTDLGVKREVVKTGPSSDGESFLRRKTDAELALYQKGVDGIYAAFLARVAEGRKKTPESIHEIAQGRVWSGARALELGLVDRLGDLDDAIRIAAERAKLGDDYSVRYFDRKGTPLGKWIDGLTGEKDDPLAEVLAGPLRALTTEAAEVLALARANGIQARMTFRLEVK